MKKIYLTAIFIATLIGSIGLSNSFDVHNRIDNFIHRDCARWGNDWLESETFTFEEARELLNKKVISKDVGFKNKIYRVVQFHRIADGKFVVSLWIDKVTTDKQMTAFYITKEDFEKKWVLID